MSASSFIGMPRVGQKLNSFGLLHPHSEHRQLKEPASTQCPVFFFPMLPPFQPFSRVHENEEKMVIYCPFRGGAARGSRSHAHAVRGAHPARDAGSCATYEIPGSARTDALCLLWAPISRLPGRFHLALVRAKLAYEPALQPVGESMIAATVVGSWIRTARRNHAMESPVPCGIIHYIKHIT